jgi:hypothetical protein
LKFDLEVHILNRGETHSDRLSNRSFFDCLFRLSDEVEQFNCSGSLPRIKLKTPANDFLAFLADLAFVGNAMLLDVFVDLSHVPAVIEGLSV